MKLLRVIFKWLIGLLILSIIIWGIYYLNLKNELASKPQSTSSKTTKPNSIDWVMHGTTVRLTNDQGKLAGIIHSQTSQHFQANNMVTMDQPRGELYSNEASHWHIQAQKGYIDRDKHNITYLKGHVILHRHPDAKQPAITLLTHAITYNPQTHQAYTNQPLTIIRPNAQLKASGLQANLKQNKIQFYNQTQTQYAHATS